MASFFKTFGSGRGAQRQELENKYKSARMNLLIMEIEAPTEDADEIGADSKEQ